MKKELMTASDLLNELGIEESPENISMFYDISYEISSSIVTYRIEHGLNQKELGSILDCNQTMISKLESGSYNFSIKTLCDVFAKLDKKLELSIKDFSHRNKSKQFSENMISNEDAKKAWSAA